MLRRTVAHCFNFRPTAPRFRWLREINPVPLDTDFTDSD